MTDPDHFRFPPESEDLISFQSESVEFELDDPSVISDWIQQVITDEHCRLVQVTFVFVSDEYLLDLNQEYLQHDTYTDIITFPYARPPEIEGDIYISIDRVRDNAENLGESFATELHRVLIHGILHLCGYSDKTEAEARQMREKEDEKLRLLRV